MSRNWTRFCTVFRQTAAQIGANERGWWDSGTTTLKADRPGGTEGFGHLEATQQQPRAEPSADQKTEAAGVVVVLG